MSSNMKDLSLFLLKNTFGSKMKKGFRNFCNGESSTSTLDQQNLDQSGGGGSAYVAEPPRPGAGHPTLEEMIMQLEMEEKMGRKGGEFQHRMSCVNSSDILRSARNALNQYPRFSLDGKDSMYRSSFTELTPIRAGKVAGAVRLPSVVGGESVVWCKPGVVGKLMGLEAMPVPLNTNYRRERLSAIIKNQNLRKRAQKHQEEENERRRATSERTRRRRGVVGSCSRTGYCVMTKPIELNVPVGEAGWPITRFL